MMYGFITSEMFWGGLRILRRAVLTDTATTSSAILDDSIYIFPVLMVVNPKCWLENSNCYRQAS